MQALLDLTKNICEQYTIPYHKILDSWGIQNAIDMQEKVARDNPPYADQFMAFWVDSLKTYLESAIWCVTYNHNRSSGMVQKDAMKIADNALNTYKTSLKPLGLKP